MSLQFKVCESLDEFYRLFNAHIELIHLGGYDFTERTGCLPKCEYDIFSYTMREVKNTEVGKVQILIHEANQQSRPVVITNFQSETKYIFIAGRLWAGQVDH